MFGWILSLFLITSVWDLVMAGPFSERNTVCFGEFDFDCGANDRQRCISHLWHCDNVIDCPNSHLDELGCNYLHKCPVGEFICRDGGACIPAAKKCDGHADCLDDSDEIGCPKKTPGNPFSDHHSQVTDSKAASKLGSNSQKNEHHGSWAPSHEQDSWKSSPVEKPMEFICDCQTQLTEGQSFGTIFFLLTLAVSAIFAVYALRQMRHRNFITRMNSSLEDINSRLLDESFDPTIMPQQQQPFHSMK